jgi:hypothetical protein
MGRAEASKARSVLYDFLVTEVPHPLRLLLLPREEEIREGQSTLARGSFSEIEIIIMEEANISTLCSLLLKLGEYVLEGEKDMVRYIICCKG